MSDYQPAPPGAPPSKNVIDRRTATTHGLAALIAVLIGMLTGRVSAPKPDADAALVSSVSTALDRAQDFWRRELGRKWRDARVVMLDQPLGTPCGPATSETGPFYCPADEKIYIDLSFLRDVRGELARAYVVAHEIGHHAQKVNRENVDAEASVDVELEADCYAGAWMRDELGRDRASRADLEAAIGEAQAVGDDRLCPQCSPEEWTHGSAAMRAEAVGRGAAGEVCRGR